MLSEMHIVVLKQVRDTQVTDLRQISDAFREKLIDLGMHEPPLVDTDADRVFITRAGVNYLNLVPRS